MFLSLYGIGQQSNAYVKKDFLQSVVNRTTGTGQSTGHVANLVLQNTSTERMNFHVGPFLIPGNGKYQGYLIPDSTVVEIEAGETVVSKLNGFCTNVNLKPAPLDEPLVSFERWVIPDGKHKTDSENWQIPEGFYLNISQELGDFPYRLTYPGSDKTFIYSVDFDRYSVKAADLLLQSHDLLEKEYDHMVLNKNIRTPYSNNLEKQKLSILQHTFWIYCSSLVGDAYTKEEFRSKMEKQFLELVGDQKTETLEREFEKGIDDFWSSFLTLAEGAQIFKVVE